MAVLQALSKSSDPTLLSEARSIFRAYGDLLRSIAACHAFNFNRFDQEILDLPTPYTGADGDLLLALRDSTTAIGCIAFRAAPGSSPEHPACEIKRLFVRPEARGQGIAEQLVCSALESASGRGFRSAILDTEPSTMHAAQQLYRKLGFVPYTPTQPHNPVSVTYLRRDLPFAALGLTP